MTPLANAAGCTTRLFPIPIAVLSALFRISPQTHGSLIGPLELDVSKAASTGWRPPISLDEGLRLATMVSDIADPMGRDASGFKAIVCERTYTESGQPLPLPSAKTQC